MSYRFVDRDILMRYHWGIGVGHLYSHTVTLSPPLAPDLDSNKGHGDNTLNDTEGSGDEGWSQPAISSFAQPYDDDRSSEEQDTPIGSDFDEGICDSDLEGSNHSSTNDDHDYEPFISYD